MKTVVYHSADFDGRFCEAIACHFLGYEGVHYIGWDFPNPPLPCPEGDLIVMDLPLDKPFGGKLDPALVKNLVWIDHHKSAIESHATDIPGYRIDGVAACRLAYQWFRSYPTGFAAHGGFSIPLIYTKENFFNREVPEPLSVRLAGEYDIWDKRDPRAETFQYGLRMCPLEPRDWTSLLQTGPIGKASVSLLLADGQAAQKYAIQENASLVKARSFLLKWEGLTFLALNTARCNSLTFAALDVPATGHDALLAFYFNGIAWTFSLYHAAHRTDLDLSAIAIRHGGGGHRGACGFTAIKMPMNALDTIEAKLTQVPVPEPAKDCLDIPAQALQGETNPPIPTNDAQNIRSGIESMARQSRK